MDVLICFAASRYVHLFSSTRIYNGESKLTVVYVVYGLLTVELFTVITVQCEYLVYKYEP
jgi:hypothetical protein